EIMERDPALRTDISARSAAKAQAPFGNVSNVVNAGHQGVDAVNRPMTRPGVPNRSVRNNFQARRRGRRGGAEQRLHFTGRKRAVVETEVVDDSVDAFADRAVKADAQGLAGLQQRSGERGVGFFDSVDI